jgi:hypothetical protein
MPPSFEKLREMYEAQAVEIAALQVQVKAATRALEAIMFRTGLTGVDEQAEAEIDSICEEAIDALATTSTAALDALKVEVRREALEEAAALTVKEKCGYGGLARITLATRIRALAAKEGKC